AVGVDCEGIGHVESGVQGGAAIAAVPTFAGARHQCDDAGGGVHAPNAVMAPHAHKHVALSIEGAHIGGLAGCVERRTAVTAPTFLAVAEDILDDPWCNRHRSCSCIGLSHTY